MNIFIMQKGYALKKNGLVLEIIIATKKVAEEYCRYCNEIYLSDDSKFYIGEDYNVRVVKDNSELEGD